MGGIFTEHDLYGGALEDFADDDLLIKHLRT